MKLLSSLGSVTFASLAALAACGGASDTELFGSSSGATGASSGSTSSGSASGSTSSGSTSSGSTSSGSTSTSSGATSSGASGSSGTSTSGGPPPKACSSNNDCSSSEYCKVTACAPPGVCTAKPATETDPTFAPVCGCNGVTHWNADVAAFRGANVAGSGPCAGDKAASCSPSKACSNNARCNFDVGGKNQCLQLPPFGPTGTCWALPKTCPQNQGGSARSCASNACTTLCSAIDQQQTFFKVQACN